MIAEETTSERRELLSALPDEHRIVLVLVAAGLSHEEISERVGGSVRGVRKRVERAHRRLRNLAEGAE